MFINPLNICSFSFIVFGLNSPVIALVSNEQFFEIRTPSTGAFSPTLTKTISPIFTSSGAF